MGGGVTGSTRDVTGAKAGRDRAGGAGAGSRHPRPSKRSTYPGRSSESLSKPLIRVAYPSRSSESLVRRGRDRAARGRFPASSARQPRRNSRSALPASACPGAARRPSAAETRMHVRARRIHTQRRTDAGAAVEKSGRVGGPIRAGARTRRAVKDTDERKSDAGERASDADEQRATRASSERRGRAAREHGRAGGWVRGWIRKGAGHPAGHDGSRRVTTGHDGSRRVTTDHDGSRPGDAITA